VFNDQVFGVDDPDTGVNRKPNRYLSGLVPSAETVADRTTKYLRADGTWAEVPIVDDTKVGNLNIFKGGTDYTFLYHGNNNNADAIRLGPSMLQLNSGGSSSTSASIDFSVGGSMFCQMSQYSDSINFIKNVEFTADIEWTPDGVNKVPLLDMYEDVNIIKNKNVPDFDDITTANKFLITNTANGGSITYITPTTDMINEGNNNLYYTDERVEAEIQIKMESGELTNIITNQLQAQTLVANSDIRLKENIKKIEKTDIDKLIPVEYNFKNNIKKRFGFIAQDVEEDIENLVYTDEKGMKGINYQDIIALLVKDNQDLRKRIGNLENLISNK
jgi:hypothetical protein